MPTAPSVIACTQSVRASAVAATPAVAATTAVALAIVGLGCGISISPPEESGNPQAFVLDCGVHASLSVRLPQPAGGETPLNGDVRLTVRVSTAESVSPRYALDFSTDGGSTWRPATLRGLMPGLHPIPNDTEQEVLWDTVADLGVGGFREVVLRITPFVPCGPGPSEQVSGLSIVNDTPRCAISIRPFEKAVDGAVEIDFELTYPQARHASTHFRWRIEGDEVDREMTLRRVDCDGDGNVDPGDAIAVSPRGVPHCAVWDSQADLLADATVSFSITCRVHGIERGRRHSLPIRLQNDPTPDPGEIRFSEFMLRSGFAHGAYIELMNVAGHTLNLRGATLQRWAASGDPDSQTPRNHFILQDPTGVIAVASGQRLLLGRAGDPQHNGCVSPDVTWPNSFAANDDSLYRLEHGGQIIAEQSVYRHDGWVFSEGVAWGLAPLGTGDGAHRADWCEQRSRILTCHVGQDTEIGTPGDPNDPCR